MSRTVRPGRVAGLAAIAALLAGCVGPAPAPLSLPGAPPESPPAPPPPTQAALPAPGAQDAGLALSAALDLAARGPDGSGEGAAPVTIEPPLPDGSSVPVALLSLPDSVFFDFGQSAPRAGSEAAFASLVRAIRAAPSGTVLTVAGNTDSIGADALNRSLSEARARAVVAGLEARGVPAARLDPVGFGASRPIASNATEAGRARNRRVELALSRSADANREALLALAAQAAPPAPAAASSPAPAGGGIRRTPTPLSVRKNRPARLHPNTLGPPVSY